MENIKQSDGDKKGILINYAGLILAVFFILPIISWGFSLGTILILLIWFLYFKLRAPQQKLITITNTQHIILLFVLAVLSVILTGFATTERLPKVTNNFTYNLNGQNLVGIVDIDEYSNGRVNAAYFLLLKDSLDSNYVCKPETACSEHIEYTYVLDLVRDTIDDEGMISRIHCNKDILPDDPRNPDTSIYYDCDKNSGTTDTFTVSFTSSFNSLEEFLQASTLNIHDGSNFWYIEDKTVTEQGEFMTHSVDLMKSITENPVYRSYTLNFEELDE